MSDLEKEVLTLLRENKDLKEENDLLKEHHEVDQKSLSDAKNNQK